MSDLNSTTWMLAAQWPGTLRQRYFYWAEGRAADLRGARTWIEVAFTAGSYRGCSIDATWQDDAGRRLLHVLANVGTPRPALSYGGPSGPLAQAVAEPDEGRAHVERGGDSDDYALPAGLPFLWRLVWPLAIQFVPWHAGLAGALSMFDLATASGSPFSDGPTTVDITTEDGEAMVAAPNGGHAIGRVLDDHGQGTWMERGGLGRQRGRRLGSVRSPFCR